MLVCRPCREVAEWAETRVSKGCRSSEYTLITGCERWHMSLDKATVAKIAHLARIKVEEKDLETLAGELNNILGFVDQLNEVDTENVPPMTSGANMALRWRKDEVTDGGYADKVVQNAPAREDSFFAVPKVVE